MKFTFTTAVTAVSAIALGAAGAMAQVVHSPEATYWVSAATSSGFGGLGGRPSASAIAGMMTGRGMGSSVQHSLTLQLGSRDRPQGAPHAEHLPPLGLGVGSSLPLVTPVTVRSERGPGELGMPNMERPKGRMLIYWGCGEHVGPGQPKVIDFSKLGRNMPMPAIAGALRVNAQQPPDQGRSVTYGEWPNERNSRDVPATGSLVGSHTVKGDYTPDINFRLAPGQDFMPAIRLSNAGKSPAGATRLTWTPLQQATGYSLLMMGANGQEGGGADLVFWSSSKVPSGMMGGGLMDYLAPSEVHRLIAQGAVLPPQTGQCLVPAEVSTAVPMGMLSMIAYGSEANFSEPPHPAPGAKYSWATKVRFKSTTNMMLGMPSMDDASDDEDRGDAAKNNEQKQQPKKRSKRPGLGDLLGGFIPHP